MQTRVFLNHGFAGLTASKTRVPGYLGLIMSVRRPARVDGKPTVSGHFNSLVRHTLAIRGGRRLMEVS